MRSADGLSARLHGVSHTFALLEVHRHVQKSCACWPWQNIDEHLYTQKGQDVGMWQG